MGQPRHSSRGGKVVILARPQPSVEGKLCLSLGFFSRGSTGGIFGKGLTRKRHNGAAFGLKKD